MKTQTLQYRRYLMMYLGALTVVALPLLCDFIFIRNSGETLPFGQIVELQQKQQAIYGPAYTGIDFRYKLALIGLRKPDVLVVGASRVMSYRAEIFRGAFVNAGGAMNHLNEGLIFLKEAFKVHRPKVLFIGLENSWFIDEFAAPTVFESHSADETKLTRDKILDPLIQVLKGKISLRDYLTVVAGRRVQSRVFGNPSYGIAAMADVRGNLPDGSALYTSLYSGVTPSASAAKFAEARDLVQRGIKRFEHAAHISAARWQVFEQIIALCKANNVKLVTILNPFAPGITTLMNSMKAQYGYLDELRAALRARTDFEFYDFSDASSFGSNDCEFLDGHHPGHIACFRIMRELARRNPKSALAPEIRTDFLDKEIGQYGGHALWPGNLLLRFRREVDFLQLGCVK